jgi:hypothetical protein
MAVLDQGSGGDAAFEMVEGGLFSFLPAPGDVIPCQVKEWGRVV